MGGGHCTHVQTTGHSWWLLGDAGGQGFKMHRRKGMKDEAGQISKGDQTLCHI